MLVLSRKREEAITITLPDGEQINIIITGISSNQVRLGIVANEENKIIRDELLENE